MEEKIIRNIPGYEGYKVSIDGVVIRIKGEYVVKQSLNHQQYAIVHLFGSTRSVQRLVALAFPEICGEWFEGAEVDHIDGNRLNNNAYNLRVCTHLQNMRNPLTKAKKKLAACNKGNLIGMYSKDGTLLYTFISMREAERQTGITSNNISLCCSGKRAFTGKKGGPKYAFKWIEKSVI